MIRCWRNYTRKLMFRHLYGGTLTRWQSFLVGRMMRKRMQDWRERRAARDYALNTAVQSRYADLEKRQLLARLQC